MADWATISEVGTASGTLVLAVATFASVRSANRSARIAELALQEQRRPLLVHSRLDDPVQKIGFQDDHWVRVEGSQAVAEEDGGNIYLVVGLRNVGAGIAVLQGWLPHGERLRARGERPEPDEFREQGRDLYIPPGDIGLWQGALRDRNEPAWSEVARAIHERRAFSLDLLYSDQVGGQRTISRFGIVPTGEERWLGAVARHWNVDGPGARD